MVLYIEYNAIFCRKGKTMEDSNFVNNSGQGKDIEIPKEVKRFSWGAFFFGWIWGLFNKSYLTLIGFAVSVLSLSIAFFLLLGGLSGGKEVAGLMFLLIMLLNIVSNIVGFALSIWFGVKGNDWAWQNKKWDSLKHFHDVQRIWAIVGTVVIGLGVTGIVAAMTIPSLMMSTDQAKNRVFVLKSVSLINQAALMNEAMDTKCNDLSSNGLASCFGEQLNKPVSGNKIVDEYSGGTIEFYGNSYCSEKNSCYVKIIANGVDEKVGLYLDNGYVKINPEDSEKIANKYSSSKRKY